MSKLPPLSKAREVCAIPCFDQAKVNAIRTDLAVKEQGLLEVANAYRLLGNDTRLKILVALEHGELCVCDLAHVLGLSIAATSHQLKLLRDQGWLRKRDDGKMVYYRLRGANLLTSLLGDLLKLGAGVD